MGVTSIILAGGKSRRLGRRKALEVIGGNSLIERVVERLKPVTDQLLIVTSEEQRDLLVISGAEVLVDIYPGRGPLGGIYTGLVAAQSSQSIAVACDMPFVNAELLCHMIEMGSGFDAVVPRWKNGKIEPLHAIYSKSGLAKMARRVENKQLWIYSLIDELNVRYVEEEECRGFDPQLLTFLNINSESDLERATKLIEERRPPREEDDGRAISSDSKNSQSERDLFGGAQGGR